jgi:hypothetical protein
VIGDNLRYSDNPPFTLDDFKAMYPQFQGGAVPDTMLSVFLELADKAINIARWRAYWQLAMGLFIAHFATLWATSTGDPDSDAAGVIAAGQARGLMASKSVDSVSYSYDYATSMTDLNGWAAWKLTTFGTQLATIAKMAGKGGMQVW